MITIRKTCFIILLIIIYLIIISSIKKNILKNKHQLYLSKMNSNNTLNFLKKELANFFSFSQCYEDLILFIILFDTNKGFYIDIGAFDPVKGSVTQAFYTRGWHGINIEPQPEKIELFNKDRPNDTNLQICIGKKKGFITFYVNKALSTVQKKYAGTAKKNITIKMDTMGNICKKYIPKGTKIDFCKIDVEGNEKDVLLGYDFIEFRPKVFCIESTIPLSNIPNYQLWEDILIKNNYVFVYEQDVNRFYVDNNIPELIYRSHYIEEYFKIANKTRYTTT